MKTLVIIDDEVFFRKSICNFLNTQNEYKIIGEANNGKAGIDLIRQAKPDIAVVDISMPLMNGLEMIQSLSSDCYTKFILLTGFEYFDYAKQAITLGVKQYLLKPLDNQELLNALHKISVEIDEEQCRSRYINDYFQTRDLYQHQIILNFFHKAVSGNCQPEEYAALRKQTGLPKTRFSLVLLLKIIPENTDFWDMNTDFSLLHSILENICSELFRPHYPAVLYINYSHTRQSLFLGADDLSAFSRLTPLCLNLINLLKNVAQVYVNIYSGTPHDEAHGIKLSYEEALSALHNRNSDMSSGFLQFHPKTAEGHEPSADSIAYENLLFLLRQKKEKEVLEYLSDYFDKAQANNLHIRQTWNVTSVFLTILDNFITECGNEISDFLTLQKAFDNYQNCGNMEQLKQMILDTYRSVLLQAAHKKNSKSTLVEDVQKYISENYNNPNLRLETIAAQFYVSPQYLSSLFSQESSQTLTTYINACRMQKAKALLLQQSPSISNTALLCGFTDSGYFSKCFRKYYGISPKNFLTLSQKNQR